MNVRNSLIAASVAAGLLLGGPATASATTHEAPASVRPICGIHYKLVRDLNGHWYCKFAPERRHNRHDRERRQQQRHEHQQHHQH